MGSLSPAGEPTALTERAQLFLRRHGRRTRGRSPVPRVEPGGPWSVPPPGQHPGDTVDCDPDGSDGGPEDEPDGGDQRLIDFAATFGGLSFCPERPECRGLHRTPYEFDDAPPYWRETDLGCWVANVGHMHGWPLTWDWSTGRIGIDVVDPCTWLASGPVNLIESAALGQSIYGNAAWREAVAVGSRGPGWGLDVPAERFGDLVPEVSVASSPYNRWYGDEHVTVHGWRVTYDGSGATCTMAWYRDGEGRALIESVAGPSR